MKNRFLPAQAGFLLSLRRITYRSDQPQKARKWRRNSKAIAKWLPLTPLE